jgi:hypothetical protein
VSTTVTNTASTAQTVKVTSTELAPPSFTHLDQVVTAKPTTPAVSTKITVPKGLDDLTFVETTAPNVHYYPTYTVLDPHGRYVEQSWPVATRYARVDVPQPEAGDWTIVTDSSDQSYPVSLTTTGAALRDAGVTGAPVTIPAGGTAAISASATLPAATGDAPSTLVLSGTDGRSVRVPLARRTEVIPAPGPTKTTPFTAQLSGGLDRDIDQRVTTQIVVPAGQAVMDIETTLPDPSTTVQFALLDPNLQKRATTSYTPVLDPKTGLPNTAQGTASLLADHPEPGVWQLMTTIPSWDYPAPGGSGGGAPEQTMRGVVSFPQPSVRPVGVPHGDHLPAGKPVKTQITITNPAGTTQDFFLDPRLTKTSTVTLAPSSPDCAGQVMSRATGWASCQFVVPSQTTKLTATATATTRINTSLSDPADGVLEDQAAVSAAPYGKKATVSMTAPQLTSGQWTQNVSEAGPLPDGYSTQVVQSSSVTANTQVFDPAAFSSTGDYWWQSTNQNKGMANPLDPASPFYDKDGNIVVTPRSIGAGVTSSVNVTFIPQGPSGTVVTGIVYVNVGNPGKGVIGQVTAIPYSYTIT